MLSLPSLLCSLGKFSYTWSSFFREKEILVTRVFTNTNLLFTLEERHHKMGIEAIVTSVLQWLIYTLSLFFLYAAHFQGLKKEVLILPATFSQPLSQIFIPFDISVNSVTGDWVSQCTSHRPFYLDIPNAFTTKTCPQKLSRKTCIDLVSNQPASSPGNRYGSRDAGGCRWVLRGSQWGPVYKYKW